MNEKNFKNQQESGTASSGYFVVWAAARGRAKRARGLCRHLPRVRVSGAG